jgi:hypothetical protein
MAIMCYAHCGSGCINVSTLLHIYNTMRGGSCSANVTMRRIGNATRDAIMKAP